MILNDAGRTAQRRPTILDVARLANVSISTVSRVINASAPVAESTVQQVWQAIAALEYVPNAAARSLAGRRTATVGLYLPQVSGAFFATLLQGIEAGVRGNGYDLLIHAHPNVSPSGPLASLPLGEHNTDGLLVFADSMSDADVVRMHERGYPLVLLFRSPPPGARAPSINVENKANARLLVDHLIEAHGCRRIAYLRGPVAHQDSAWREKGYLEALANHGIAPDPELIGHGNFARQEAHQTVADWLARGIRPDAIFAGNDDAASGVLIALREAGLNAPADIAIVGFDDLPWASALTPPLTTVNFPLETIGLLAGQSIVKLIQTGKPEPDILIPANLVIRQSCGCP